MADISFGCAFASPDPERAIKPYLAIISQSKDTKYILIFVIIGIFFVITNIAQIVGWFVTPQRFWFKFSRLGTWANVGFNFVLGTLLLPITLWLAFVLKFPPDQRPIEWIVVPVLFYVVFNFAMYWQTMDDSNDSVGAIFWTIQLAPGQNQHSIADYLNDFFKDIPWLSDCEISSNSQDGHLALEIPIVYALHKWPKADLNKFWKLYKDSTKYLKKKDFEVLSKSQSPSVKKIAAINSKRAK